jgi:hypothetical protein
LQQPWPLAAVLDAICAGLIEAEPWQWEYLRGAVDALSSVPIC